MWRNWSLIREDVRTERWIPWVQSTWQHRKFFRGRKFRVAETEGWKGAPGLGKHCKTSSSVYVGAQQWFPSAHIRLLRTPEAIARAHPAGSCLDALIQQWSVQCFVFHGCQKGSSAGNYLLKIMGFAFSWASAKSALLEQLRNVSSGALSPSEKLKKCRFH